MADSVRVQADFLSIERTIVDYLDACGFSTSCDEGEWIAREDGGVVVRVSSLAFAIAEALDGGR